MIVLDKLLGAVIPDSNIELLISGEDGISLTFYQVIFTLWIRDKCGLNSGLKALTLDEAKSAFKTLRKGETSQPYKMTRFKDEFIKNLSSRLSIKGDDGSILKDTLSLIWDEFEEEYVMIDTDDLEPRFSRFILIE